MAVSKTATDSLAKIKENISASYHYFKDNFDRYHNWQKYLYKETISTAQRAILNELSRPVMEFNILEAYVSRLLGEFSKHEPSISVTSNFNSMVKQQLLDVIEGHLRQALFQANKDNFSYDIYKDMLSGGFSVGKVWTDYESPMSFDQGIFLGRAFDPTLCGFDPLARQSHKGDGDYSFETYPMGEKEFKAQFPGIPFKDNIKTGSIEEFTWTYQDADYKDIIMVGEYFEKKKKKTKIVQLRDKTILTEEKYEQLKELWNRKQFIEQMPIVIGKPRTTYVDYVCRYRLIENEVIDYTVTDYTYLPHVFFDGNSQFLTRGNVNNCHQMTRPYLYNAKGIQDLTNYSGMTIANHMENLVQHKIMIAKESLPQEKDYLKAFQDLQKQNTIVYQAYSENDPNKPVPPPQFVQQMPLPPDVLATFQLTGGLSQEILGSYASNMGKNDNDLSGKAVIEASSVGNAASMPYIVGFLKSLGHIGTIFVDLMPKYLLGERHIPVVTRSGEHQYQKINADDAIYLDYQPHNIKVNIDAGVNFQVQKNQAVQQIIALMSANETLGEFFSSEEGLPILAKNLTIYGADGLEESIETWFQKRQQQQEQQQQMQQQMMMQDPRMIKAQADIQQAQAKSQADMAKTELQQQEMVMKAEQQQVENNLAIAKLGIDKQLADAQVLEAEAKVSQAQIDSAVRMEEANTSRVDHALDAAAKMAEVRSREHDDRLKAIELHHKINTEMNHDEIQHKTE